MTYMAFKVLCFLMLYKDFLIIKIPITVPAPRLELLLLLTAHSGVTPTYKAGEPSAPSEQQRPRGRPGPSERHKMAAELPQAPLRPPNSRPIPKAGAVGNGELSLSVVREDVKERKYCY